MKSPSRFGFSVHISTSIMAHPWPPHQPIHTKPLAVFPGKSMTQQWLPVSQHKPWSQWGNHGLGSMNRELFGWLYRCRFPKMVTRWHDPHFRAPPLAKRFMHVRKFWFVHKRSTTKKDDFPVFPVKMINYIFLDGWGGCQFFVDNSIARLGQPALSKNPPFATNH